MAVSGCLSVCLSTSISPELHARTNFYACYLYSGVRTIHYFLHFFLPVCVYYVMYYFVMGGQLRWANASTGSLPL